MGGAVTYGALTAQALGLKPSILTTSSPDVDVRSAVPSIPTHVIPHQSTTTFENIYHNGRRTQHIRAVGGPITPADVPSEWMAAPMVMLGPLAAEVSPHLAQCFPDALVVASIQGWLRRWDAEGKVSPADWDGSDVLPYVDAATLSEDDIQDTSPLNRWSAMTPVLAFTKGARGADIHINGKWHHIEAFAADALDPTGAGDVFTAAYMVRFSETADALESARFAVCAASFCVEAHGTDGIPTRAQVERRLG